MQIFELSHIGQFHTNHNEDYLIQAPISSNKIMIALMDGCSTGTDSHFAATLSGKILRKLAKDENYKEFISKKSKSCYQLLKELMANLFSELSLLKSRLDLADDEILHTVILGIIDTANKTGEILVLGDGLVCVDEKIAEFEQDNKPDYIGYHLSRHFESWFAQQEQFISIPHFYDLSIATDGLHTFKKFNLKNYEKISPDEIIDLFFKEQPERANPNMLKKQLIRLEKKYGLKPSDDLSIIRLIAEN